MKIKETPTEVNNDKLNNLEKQKTNWEFHMKIKRKWLQ